MPRHRHGHLVGRCVRAPRWRAGRLVGQREFVVVEWRVVGAEFGQLERLFERVLLGEQFSRELVAAAVVVTQLVGVEPVELTVVLRLPIGFLVGVTIVVAVGSVRLVVVLVVVFSGGVGCLLIGAEFGAVVVEFIRLKPVCVGIAERLAERRAQLGAEFGQLLARECTVVGVGRPIGIGERQLVDELGTKFGQLVGPQQPVSSVVVVVSQLVGAELGLFVGLQLVGLVEFGLLVDLLLVIIERLVLADVGRIERASVSLDEPIGLRIAVGLAVEPSELDQLQPLRVVVVLVGVFVGAKFGGLVRDVVVDLARVQHLCVGVRKRIG